MIIASSSSSSSSQASVVASVAAAAAAAISSYYILTHIRSSVNSTVTSKDKHRRNPNSIASMKYAIVTGASPSSIGFLAAKKLASPEFGYKVILACRSSDKGREAETLIRSSYPSCCEVVYIHLDLASFDSIRKFVDDVHALDDGAIGDTNRPDSSLEILVNNAGVGWGSNTPFLKTSDGLEEIVGVNHFGTFLLTNLLLDDLKRSEGGSRIVTVSSSLHEWNERPSKTGDEGANDEDNQEDPGTRKLLLPDFPRGIFQSNDGYDGGKAYRVSKLCNLWFSYELQRRLDEEAATESASPGGSESTALPTKSSVRVNAVSPGFIPSTGLARRAGVVGIFFLRFVLDPLRYIGWGVTRSPGEGAETIVQAGTADIASKGGEYFMLPKNESTIVAIASSDESLDVTKAKDLWDLSLETCKLEN